MKIGEVSAVSGISQRMIRHYEKIGLIPEAARRDSGYRDYDTRELHTLHFIGRARDLGFPIEDIRREFAPYVGVQYRQAFGKTRQYLREEGEDAAGWSLLTGVRMWF